MANSHNPPAKAGETDIVAARREAAAKLHPLFEEARDKDGNPTRGLFHIYGIPEEEGKEYPKESPWSDPNNVKFVNALRANPHARTLVTVAAANGLEDFPPDLVTEFLSPIPPELQGEEREKAEKRKKWFAKVYLGGLAVITQTTGGKRGLWPPPNQADIDLAWAAWGVFSRLSDEEREKLGIGEEPQRRPPTTLQEIAEYELSLTPVQQLYRWAKEKREKSAEQAAERRAKRAAERRAKRGSTQPEDLAGNLPPAAKPEAPTPAPTPAGPAVPDLAALTGGGETKPQAPKPAGKKTVAAAPVAPAAPPPAEGAKPTVASATVADEDQELILAAIEAADTPAAKAMLALVKAGKKTAAEAAAWATRKGLL
jgi:hypothetical protein